MKERERPWPFLHAIFDQDANQFRWTTDVGYDKQLAGPYPTVRDCEGAALSEAALPLKAYYEKVVVEKLMIVHGKFIKVFRNTDDNFMVAVQNWDEVNPASYSTKAWETAEAALDDAVKRNSFSFPTRVA